MPTVTRAYLAEKIHDEHPGLTQEEAKEIVDETIDLICSTLARREEVKVSSFGTFTPHRMPARRGRNPKRPEEEHDIPSQSRVVFKPARTLKEQVDAGNKSRGRPRSAAFEDDPRHRKGLAAE